MRVTSGEADLYVLKGTSTFPDLNTFDFRSNTIKNDEIYIPAESNKSKDGETQTYTIGVYAPRDAAYVLEATDKSNFYFRPIVPGEIISQSVRPDKPLLLSMSNAGFRDFVIGASTDSDSYDIYYH